MFNNSHASDFKIISEYEIIKNNNKLYICIALCNNIYTKYITKTKWNYKISVKFDNHINDLIYKDTEDQQILVFEKNESEYELY